MHAVKGYNTCTSNVRGAFKRIVITGFKRSRSKNAVLKGIDRNVIRIRGDKKTTTLR
jgi:hypothetical protein